MFRVGNWIDPWRGEEVRVATIEKAGPDLSDLTATDVMVPDVVKVAPDMPVAELVQLLSDRQISGAPVVNGDGALLGVVSATDVLRLASHSGELDSGDTTFWNRDRPTPMDEADEEMEYLLSAYYTEPGDGDLLEPVLSAAAPLFEGYFVRDIMTPATFVVAGDTSLREVARNLARGRIHRLLVVDGSELQGIVTSFDIVRAVAGDVAKWGPGA